MRDPEIPHRYICECGDPSCLRDVLLTSSEWLPLSERGQVVHVDCMERMRSEGQRMFIAKRDLHLNVAVIVTQRMVA